MTDIKLGDVVDIAIKGVRMGERSPIRVTIEDESGELWALPPQAAIKRVAPAEWPPRTGDLWRDRDGDLWLGMLVDDDDDANEPYVVLRAARSSKSLELVGNDNGDVLSWHGPLILVHREEGSDA